MPVRRSIPYTFGTFFITFTNHRWIPLIKEANGYDIVYKWFDYLKSIGHYLHGYVIMPNHVHSLISFSESEQNINKVIGNGKRFMAYDLVDRLKSEKKVEILSMLESAVPDKRRIKNQLHVVWEPSFDWKYCKDLNFVLQKLDYIHSNPCKGKWNLCESPIDYLYSSAMFYLTGEEGVYPVTHIGELGEINLSGD